jgi:predicted phosphodiesterase/HD superfamily phosphodiesterase
MTIALIGDVHANAPALEAVLAHARRMGATEIWDTGDAVGYGPHPNEVLRLLRRAHAVSVLGNVDRKILELGHASDPAPTVRDDASAIKRWTRAWSLSRLTDKARAALADRPIRRRLTRDGHTFLLVHGSPESDRDYLSPLTPSDVLRRWAAWARDQGLSGILCGHAHQPLARQVDGIWFINSGSVGRPDDGDPRAAYAILETNGRIRVRHLRVAYDTAETRRQLRREQAPEALANMIARGLSLESLLADAPAAAHHAVYTPADRDAIREECRRLAHACLDDDAHSRQVAKLALALFDALAPRLRLGDEERFCLECAGWLHDIGWADGGRRHHKASRDRILTNRELALDRETRRRVALIARYHRRAWPSHRHAAFAALPPPDRRRIRLLAAILRVADGLDASHRQAVAGLTVRLGQRRLAIELKTERETPQELEAAGAKGDLLEHLLGMPLDLRLAPVQAAMTLRPGASSAERRRRRNPPIP